MNLASLLPGTESLVKSVGKYLLKVQHNVVAEEKSGPENLVSEADREAERLLRAGLSKILPEAEFRGEESGWSPWPDDAWCWVVDPLDGTKPYLHGKDGWGIIVALCRGGSPELGVIHLPTSGTTYSAITGRDAMRDGRPLTPRHEPPFIVLAGVQKLRALEAAGVPDSVPTALFLPSDPSVTLFTKVLDGDAYAYVNVRMNTYAWDLVAGDLLVRAAGGRCSDTEGRPLRFNTADPLMGASVFSRGELHDELCAVLLAKGFR